MQTEPFAPGDITVGDRMRAVDDEAVDRLAGSIREIGLQTPLTIRWVNDEDGELSPVLVAGRHRLAAAIKLGLPMVQCIVLKGSETDARLWEIAENLHRANLSPDERDEHIREWVALVDEKGRASPPLRGGEQPNYEGKKRAARDLGVDPKTVREALALGNLSNEARDAANVAGLNRKEKIAVSNEPAEAQPAKIHELAERRVKPAPAIKNAFESEEDWRRALFNVWNRGAQDWRERAMETIDAPVFDSTRFGT
jgi:ParB-like chromosome segregation protein Spo0J